MSVAEILEAIHRLPEAERCELVAFIENEFFGFGGEPTPEQIADLERRAREARQNPENAALRDAIRSELLDETAVQTPAPGRASLEPYFSAIKELPPEERLILAHRLWEEFMEEFTDWPMAPNPEGVFAWKTLQSEIAAMLSSADRLELAQRVWKNIQENGPDHGLTEEQVREINRRTEAIGEKQERRKAFEEVLNEIKTRPVSSQELKAGEGAVIGRRLQKHLEGPAPVVSFQEAKARLAAKYGK